MSQSFKTIHPVMSAKDMINVILSKTQRKTPTVVHPGYEITRIRAFYMRKVKFTQENIHEKLDTILKDFPKLEDVHPFIADLFNVLYDKDHYKLALGHVNACRNVVDNISKDYNRLLKYGDSLYRCKMLKRAALGRMMTTLKKLTSSLNYLDEVRKHMARLPSINPFERTLLVTGLDNQINLNVFIGFPNVGKSSFVNNITNANLDVQPYPFTTQNLYVGHTDYNFVRWQVLDTPGLLDHPLEQRNTIEMQAITALAHLKACILYFIDISETCSYSITKQIELFRSLQPLFKNKPVLIVLTKIDLKSFEELSNENKQELELLLSNYQSIQMSNKSGDGILNVKQTACELLLQSKQRAEVNQNEDSFLKGVYIAYPKTIKSYRPPQIPEVVKQEVQAKKQTLKDMQEQYGGAGVFNFPLQEHFILDNPDWKYDLVPEVIDGKNIADYVDADILQKLEQLEREEEMMQQQEVDEEIYDEEDLQLMEAKKQINTDRKLVKEKHKLRANNKVYLHRPSLNEVKETFEQKGIEPEALEERLKRKQEQKKRAKSITKIQDQMEEEDEENEMQDERSRSKRIMKIAGQKRKSMNRSRSKGTQIVRTSQEEAMERVYRKIQFKRKNLAKAGEGDNHIYDMMPKHLYSGKRKQGSNDRR